MLQCVKKEERKKEKKRMEGGKEVIMGKGIGGYSPFNIKSCQQLQWLSSVCVSSFYLSAFPPLHSFLSFESYPFHSYFSLWVFLPLLHSSNSPNYYCSWILTHWRLKTGKSFVAIIFPTTTISQLVYRDCCLNTYFLTPSSFFSFHIFSSPHRSSLVNEVLIINDSLIVFAPSFPI